MYFKLIIVIVVVLMCRCVNSWNDHFAARLTGGEGAAKEIAQNFGVQYVGQVFPDLDVYHFKISMPRPGRRWIFSSAMFLDSRVKQVLMQFKKLRVLRNQIVSPSMKEFSSAHENYFVSKNANRNTHHHIVFNDPFFKKQWYLEENWLNVVTAWSKGYNGQGITATVLDDGIHYQNPELWPNYEPGISFDVSDLQYKDDDPTPDLSKPKHNSHGTYCAAILSAAANNSFCGVGVAYKSKIGGVRLLRGKHSMLIDLQEAVALSVGSRFDTDIVVSSWGPPDDGKHIDKPGDLAGRALLDGIIRGRKGKGVIFVWAVGNGGIKDNCNLDGYVSSIYTISVNALTKSGFSCLYNEPCSASLTSVYVGGKHHKHETVPHDENMVVPLLNGGCTSTFEGTSAAAPLLAGIIALMLQSNNNLTWRDVQHIIVKCSRKPVESDNWKINGAGLSYHLYYGFGAIDASKAVDLATMWVNVPAQRVFTLQIPSLPRDLKQNHTIIKTEVDNTTTGNMFKLEHVELNVILHHKERGKLEIFLISPLGTESQVLSMRPMDTKVTGFRGWNFVSTHFWLENPIGIWKIIIKNNSEQNGHLKDASLTLYGCNGNWNKK